MDTGHWESDNLLTDVLKNFFLQVPFKCFHEKLKEYTIREINVLFPSTFFHEINQKYPLKKSYQVSFLKTILQELEGRNEDVDEKVYHYYLKLLEQPESETHYIHYMISEDQFITVLQNTSTISDGTTGLSVWQAGKMLADYCLKNIHSFEKQNVLELGCGVGLTGLAVIFACKPSSYCFTDIHEKVLNYLESNIKLNVAITRCLTEANISYFESSDVETKISIINLPWENVDSNLTDSIKPDIILAADVVYDTTLFHPFCRAVNEFVRRNKEVRILIACTVRNSLTLEEFCLVLHQYNLVEKEIEAVTTWNSSFNDKCQVKIFSILPVPTSKYA
ncbi:putative protein N-methyltransferase FAM86B2 isoform X2 [Planococcus citri]|uniref:putative protein N-methyltransferase FAM86B2 isoform X2 n=1 Tax=Planococcus citri TaxID=170843 RepID=UPI0031F7544C